MSGLNEPVSTHLSSWACGRHSENGKTGSVVSTSVTGLTQVPVVCGVCQFVYYRVDSSACCVSVCR